MASKPRMEAALACGVGFCWEEAAEMGEGQVAAGQVEAAVPRPGPLHPTPSVPLMQTSTQAVGCW